MKYNWKVRKGMEISKAVFNSHYDEDVDYYAIYWNNEGRESCGCAYCTGTHRTVAKIAKEIWKATDATSGYFEKAFQ